MERLQGGQFKPNCGLGAYIFYFIEYVSDGGQC